MEKVMYCVTAEPGMDSSALRESLRGRVAERLAALGAHGVQVNVADDAVAPAEELRILSSPTPAEAVVSVWIDSAVDEFREPFDQAIAENTATSAAYLVTESVPVANTLHPAEPGERVDGFAQLAFLTRPTDLTVDEWLDIWLNSHTRIAIDTQATFLYVQNVVTRVLTDGATPWDAIVEEAFPAAAMTDPQVFFDSVGDDERLAERQETMLTSVQRFVDLATIEVVPTSRYVMRSALVRM